VASAIVTAFWCAWHLPLFFFVEGDMAMNAGAAVGWVASMLTGSILMTALFDSSRGSTLAVALFHGSLDVMINSPVGGALQTTMGALITILGVAVVVLPGRHRLSRVTKQVGRGDLPPEP
jgi:hypothetical protein